MGEEYGLKVAVTWCEGGEDCSAEEAAVTVVAVAFRTQEEDSGAEIR